MYQVVGESLTGKTHILKKGFATEDAALDHPVQLAHWKRIWVEEAREKEPPNDTPPTFPWAVEWVHGRAYVLDGNGKRIATLLGTQRRREQVAEILYDRCAR